MVIKKIVSFIFLLFVLGMFTFYWFIPTTINEFIPSSEEGNFSLNQYTEMQFYPNMRFSYPQISYKIENSCTLQKKDEMERAFDIIAEKTVLTFNQDSQNGDITIRCDNKNHLDGALFIAGEGGPVNVTKTDGFYVISKGEILLIRESKCYLPNVAVHELLHVLGFNHSVNPNNIMYPISKCGQIIGDDILNSLNELYTVPSYPDLLISNASAIKHGVFVDLNIIIRNHGLINSEEAKVIISSNNKTLKEVSVPPLEIGYGVTIMLKNILYPTVGQKELSLVIDFKPEELSKKNNKIILR